MISRLVMLLLLLGLPLHAATNTAASTSYAHVSTAYTACSDGDTLEIPAGTNTWTSTLTVEKGISIIGAGSNSTRIVRSGTAFLVNNETGTLDGKLVRISSIFFDGNSFGGNYMLDLTGGATSTNHPTYTRVDNCYFYRCYSSVVPRGPTSWGVIDHNTFHNCDASISFIGDGSVWDWPISAGTTNAMIIENNLFIYSGGTAVNDENENIITGGGERFVLRYNTWVATNYTAGGNFLPMETHGRGTAETWPPTAGEVRAPPIFEIYMNTIMVTNAGAYRFFNLRGGSFLVWSNTAVGDTGNTFAELTQDDEEYTWSSYDQIENSFFWYNTYNGSAAVAEVLANGWNDELIHEDRDYFLHAPDNTSGIVTWPDAPGSPNAVFTTNTTQAYYPYTPLTYPHPLVTAQDGGGEEGGGGSGNFTHHIGTLRIVKP